ncbi:uncharacterized protein T551_01851 [Pneumocystis jirovecii RU7]|uniref:Inorganic phosphate transporter Pho88 n=1 Tax=Pneumocystis jirovecii (strain RU7) TaxID=1408657 RepID=A0A0W4ZQD7_PNEJ7|nr:uncharacterized protein T551_01851 [Pneumocystis jirovecii RU7]KTW30568.1 hypothetical protein T551_01851 [Pneumocystis jirovecii RU7]
MSPQVTNLMIILGAMQISKRINFDDPEVLFYIRSLCIASNIIIALTYYICYISIKRKNVDLTTLKYIRPTNPMSGQSEEQLVVTTIKEYDISELKKAIKQSLIGFCMILVMHLYFKFSQPLLVQSILPLKTVLEGKIVQLHLWRRPATGELKRPFKKPSGLFGVSMGDDVKTDKKSIEQAEKARVGAKEE